MTTRVEITIRGNIGDKLERKHMNLFAWVNVLTIILKIVSKILADTDDNGKPDVFEKGKNEVPETIN